ncbi:MAG: hypothetical protein RBQ94_04010 [Methanimicrococcus sp.]|nr:hypothetical protein [Methanimicrococcus sp.]
MAADNNTIQLIYIGIGIFAYFTILYLTIRDLRIFRRTGYMSYRKGALKGIIASTLALAGIFVIPFMELLGIALVFVGMMVNQKGKRETIFTTAGALDRFLGKTDIVLTDAEKRENYEKYLADKKQAEKEKEKASRREKMKEQREKDEDEKS